MTTDDSLMDWRKEHQLIVRATSGDQDALMDLVMYYFNPLERYIERQLSGSPTRAIDADDVLQESLLGAHLSIHSFHAKESGDFRAWLYKIAKNRLLDAIKAQNANKRGGKFQQARNVAIHESASAVAIIELLASQSDTPSHIVALGEAKQALKEALKMLPADQCGALRLHMIEGKTIDETAEAMGVTFAVVRRLLNSAKKQMRALLGRLSGYQ